MYGLLRHVGSNMKYNKTWFEYGGNVWFFPTTFNCNVLFDCLPDGFVINSIIYLKKKLLKMFKNQVIFIIDNIVHKVLYKPYTTTPCFNTLYVCGLHGTDNATLYLVFMIHVWFDKTCQFSIWNLISHGKGDFCLTHGLYWIFKHW